MKNVFTVKNAMELPAFRDMQLIAGRAGINRIIEHVTVYEQGALPFFSGGEFILTSGSHFTDDPAIQEMRISQLASKNIAGIAIRLTSVSFFETIPSAIIDACNCANLLQ